MGLVDQAWSPGRQENQVSNITLKYMNSRLMQREGCVGVCKNVRRKLLFAGILKQKWYSIAKVTLYQTIFPVQVWTPAACSETQWCSSSMPQVPSWLMFGNNEKSLPVSYSSQFYVLTSIFLHTQRLLGIVKSAWSVNPTSCFGEAASDQLPLRLEI